MGGLYCSEEGVNYSLCQADENECRRLGQSSYSSTPTSKSCQLRIVQNVKPDQDIIVLKPSTQSNNNCRIAGATSQCTYSINRDNNTLRFSANKIGSNQKESSYKTGCSLSITWSSKNTSSLDFNGSQFKSQNVYIAKCDNKQNKFLRDGNGNIPDYIYCISHGVSDDPTNRLGEHVCATSESEATSYCKAQVKVAPSTPDTPDDPPPAVVTPKPSVDPYDDERD